MSKSSQKVQSKICRVCGGTASAFNFGGQLSCDSCKIFFRRSSFRRNELECYFGGKCKIDVITRKHCAKCRLEKCFAIGMKIGLKGARNNENQCVIKREENCALPNPNQNLPENSIIKNPNPSTSTMICQYEMEYIIEVQNASKLFENETQLPLAGEARHLAHAFSLADFYAKRIVRFCKNISAFKTFCPGDQFALLKPFYVELCAIRFAFNFANNKGGICFLANETGNRSLLFNGDLMRGYTSEEVLLRTHLFMQSLYEEIDQDSVVRDLLIAKLLFTPRENVVNEEFIRYHHYIYSKLLHRYLECKYGSKLKADRKYGIFMYLLSKSLQQMKHDVEQILRQLDVNDLGTVIVEVFDLI